MEIRYSTLIEPKLGSGAGQYEDAFAFSDTPALAAVCDGAGTAIESRLWARLLAQGFVENPPLGGTVDDLLKWVDLIAAQWSQETPWQTLNFYEEQKARQGSAATLVGLQLFPPPQQATAGTWRCLALGNSCLFQVSQGQLVEALPLSSSADFNSRPPLLYTERSLNLTSVGQMVTKAGTWQEGDTFFLLTDAIALWFLRESERGAAPWDILTSADQRLFRGFVQKMRHQGLMRNDDVTALMIGLGVPLGAQERPVPVSEAGELAPARPRDTVLPGPPFPAEGRASSAPPRPSSRGGPDRDHKKPKRQHPRSDELNDAVSRAVRASVRPGLLAFNPPAEMVQGRKERVEVGIARSHELREALAAGLRGRGEPQFEDVLTSAHMGVELKGPSFEIIPFSPLEQFVVPSARWEFDVLPCRSGQHALTLCVSLRIDPAHSSIAASGRIAVPVLEREIQIRVDIAYSTRRFVGNNWQWLIATILGLGGGLAAWVAFIH